MLHIVGSITLLTLSALTSLVFLAFWVIMPNKNNRKDILAATIGVTLAVAFQSAVYLSGDHRITRFDSVKVSMEEPVLAGVAGVLLTVAIGLFLSIDYHIYLVLISKVAMAALFFGIGYASGFNTPSTWVFWCISSIVTVMCGFVIAIWAKKRDKDNLAWLIILYVAIFLVMYNVAWICGPAFLATVSSVTEYWIRFVANLALFIILPIIINILQGDEDSILSKVRGKFQKHQQDKYCNQPLMAGEGV